MCRIICLHYLFRKELRRDVNAFPKQRHLKFKLMQTHLHFPFGMKKVLAAVISINFVKEHELFDERHVLKAIQRVIPHVETIQHSFFIFQDAADTIRSVYVELEKIDRTNFTLDEIKQLNVELPSELKGSIEQLTRSIFMPRNEEEIFRHVMTLTQELKYVRDLPQVIISFHEQTDRTLIFNVILLRLLIRNTPSIQELFKLSEASITFISDQVKVVGNIRKRYAKEANIFSLQFDKEQFLRKDHSVDLYKAREYVVTTLERIVGEVRDYNGGLMLKQNQLLASVKELLDESEVQNEFLLENIFYALTPAVMQSLLHPVQIKELFSLFLAVFKPDVLKKDSYLLKTHDAEDYIILMIRAEEASFVKDVNRAVDALDIDSLDLASTFISVHGSSYQGYLFRNSDLVKKGLFCQAVDDAMEGWIKHRRSAQRLRISLPRAMFSLDPRIGTDRTSGIVIKMLYEGLMRIGRNGSPVSGSAQQVKVSADLKTYTFILRDSQWSNGAPVTAYDFEYGWKNVLDPDFKTLYAYVLYPIKNARAIKENGLSSQELGVQVIDDKTLVVHLENPSPYFLDLTTHWVYSPLCHNIDKVHPGWSHSKGADYVCNGPFRLADWKRNQEIHLIKNPLYWDAEAVQLRVIDIAIVEDSRMALEMFEEGELDWVGEPLSEIPLDAMLHLQKEGKILRHPIAGVSWIEFNVERFPFHHPKLRRALGYAVNRQGLIDEVLKGGERLATSVLPPNLSLSKSSYFQDGDKAIAKLLFNEALQELGLTKERLPLLILSYSVLEGQKAIATFIQKQWKDVFDLDVNIEGFSWDVYFDRMTRHEFQMVLATQYSWFNDPIYNLGYAKYKKDMNWTQWEDGRYVELLDAAEQCHDIALRSDYLCRAEKLLLEEMPVCPLYYTSYKFMKKQRVKEVYISDLGQIDFKWTYIASERQQVMSWHQTPLVTQQPSKSFSSYTQTVSLGLQTEPKALDPRMSGEKKTQIVTRILFEGLMRIAQNGKPYPGIAQSVHISDDKMTYTFKLRKTFWSNGTPVTAHDFAYSWKSNIMRETDIAYHSIFMIIKNAKDVMERKLAIENVGIVALNDYTLVVHLEHPAPYFLELIANPLYAPICMETDKKDLQWMWRSGDGFVCNGPFKLLERERNGNLRLVKNDDYWDVDNVYLNGILFVITPDPYEALAKFERDEFQWVGEPFIELPPKSVHFFHQLGKLHSFPSSGVFWYALNIKNPPFNSKKMRQAFAYAIDRKALIEVILKGDEKPALSVLSKSMTLYEKPLFSDGDFDHAKWLFEEGLKELGLTRHTLPPIVMSYSFVPGHKGLAEAIQQQWNQLFEIEVGLEGWDWHAYNDNMCRCKFQIAGAPWYSWFSDPIYNLNSFKHSAYSISGTNWEHPEYCALLREAEMAQDPDERKEHLRKAEHFLIDEMPVIPLYYHENKYLKKECLKGVYLSELGHVDLKWAYVQQKS